MRHKRQKNSPLKLIGLASALLVCLGGLGIMTYQTIGKKTPDKFGCFNGIDAPQTLVFVDVSQPRWNDEQARVIRNYFDALYENLNFNEALKFYTSEGHQIATAVPVPSFHVCGQAESPRQLEAINAPAGEAGYLQKQKQRLYEKVLLPELNPLLSLNPDGARRQLNQSPILEMIKSLSRDLRPGDHLVIVSDLINNSDSVKFCRRKNDLPRFSVFKKRSVYLHRLKPEDMSGVAVDLLMLQRGGYAQGELEYCREDEIQRFYRDYLIEQGVDTSNFIRVRHGFDVGAAQ